MPTEETAEMSSITEILKQAETAPPDHENIVRLLSVTENSERQELYTAARNLKYSVSGKFVSLRGVVEFSNICCCAAPFSVGHCLYIPIPPLLFVIISDFLAVVKLSKGKSKHSQRLAHILRFVT